MNRQEAEEVLKIMVTADGGCLYCAQKLFIRFIEEFPEFRELAEEIFEERFGKNLFDIEF